MNQYTMEKDICSMMDKEDTIKIPEKLFAFEGHFLRKEQGTFMKRTILLSSAILLMRSRSQTN